MMTSGSWRRIERSARANVSSIRALICVCATPSSAYSIGSSTVIMFVVSRGRRDSAAYSVVVLQRRVAHAERREVEARRFLIQQAQYDALAGAGRQRRDAHVDLAIAEL